MRKPQAFSADFLILSELSFPGRKHDYYCILCQLHLAKLVVPHGKKMTVSSKYFTVKSILLCHLNINHDFHLVFQGKAENASFMKIPATLTSLHQLCSCLSLSPHLPRPPYPHISPNSKSETSPCTQAALKSNSTELSCTRDTPHSMDRELEMCIATLMVQ